MGALLSGIDEAGRGSVIGPLIIVGLTLKRDKIDLLHKKGVKDSKLFTGISGRRKRSQLAIEIQQNAEKVEVFKIPSTEIDETLKMRPKDNLNLLELRYFYKLIKELNTKEIFLDTISSPHYSMTQISNLIHTNDPSLSLKLIETNKDEIKFTLRNLKKATKNIIISKKADAKYTVVAAASCVAKHIRDLRLREIEQEWDLPEFVLGQGYPNEKDRNLMYFFHEYSNQIKQRSFPFIRYLWEWKHLQQILHKPGKKLDKYF